MARAKRTTITIRVVADAILVGDRFHPNGSVLDVPAGEAKRLLESGAVEETHPDK